MLTLHPQNPSPIETHLLAEHHKSAGRLAQAEQLLRQLLATEPRFHPAYHTLGLIAFEVGKLALAVDLIRQAIAIKPDAGIYHRNLGELCRRLGQADEAIAAGKQACMLMPLDVDAHYNLGLALADREQWEAAVASYRRALGLNPGHGFAWNNLGSALELLGQQQAAEEAYLRALKINPQHGEAHNNLGALYSVQGNLDKARFHLAAAITAMPDLMDAHFNLSSLKTYTATDPHLPMLERNRARAAEMPEKARIRYFFALGKAYEDTSRYDESFAAYAQGNQLQHALLNHDESQSDWVVERIKSIFTAEFFAERRSVNGCDKAPVFIVGMPRSGTTLLEQILSSHPAVYGAGELMDLHEVINSVLPELPFPESVPEIENFARLGEAYAERVWPLAPDKMRITDKMPANFFYIGMIHLMLPNAKIIHAMRDPMDSCFSCYSRHFTQTMEFTYDLETLGRYYNRYIDLMRHWHTVLPPGKILDLRYEEMVADTEGQARRILDFLELPWDENCLAFHHNTRHVKTASLAQVRKPIYKTSVARWQRYEKHLQPLLEIVKQTRYDLPITAIPPSPATPPSAEHWHFQGIRLYHRGQTNAAIALYRQALAHKSQFPAALNSLGYALQDLDQLEEARDCFEQALAFAPDMDMARLNLGMVQLKLGDWAAGWENYEARWSGSAEATQADYGPIPCPLPQWTGEADTASSSLLVIGEQGFGDVFMCARYLLLATRRFNRVGLVCSAPVRRLMAWSLGNQVVLLDKVPPNGGDWNWKCPMMSLPRAFATRPDNIPRESPYLAVAEAARAQWQQRLDQAAPGKISIGLAWAGRKGHVYDARRSMSLAQLQPLFNDDRIAWVCLQKWDQTKATPPADILWLDWTQELGDFAETAALISALDYVITIDSAMAHLAGALNKPVWMMNRFDGEWRWLRHREDSVWYPSMRIFNQSAPGDWDSVVVKVKSAIQSLPEKPNVAQRGAAQTTPGISIEQTLMLASQHQSQGRLKEAEQLLQQILQSQPNNPFALHLLGVVAHQAWQPLLAIELIEKAIQNNASIALFHANLGEMLRQQGRLDEAINHGEEAVALEPNMASAHSNLGVAYFDSKDYERAEISHQRALQLDPQFTPSLNNLGSIWRARKQIETAKDWYRKAIAAASYPLEPLNNLGAVLLEEEKFEEARLVLEQALQVNPDYAEAVCNLGLVCNGLEQYEKAEKLFKRTLQLKPTHTEAFLGLARIAQHHENLPEALKHAQHATELASNKPEGHSLLGTLNAEMGQGSVAKTHYQRALELVPDNSEALLGLGHLCMEEGDMAQAENLFRQVLLSEPDNTGARFHMTQVKKVKVDDENFMALRDLAKEIKTMSNKKAISLHFALGKAYEDTGDYDRAFPHFLEGCRLKRASFQHSVAEDSLVFSKLMQLLDKSAIDRLRGNGNPSATPIFVLGMPRSGTTLTEQIIASHPEVYGAGELPDLMDILQRDFSGSGMRFPDNLAILDQENMRALADEYVSRLQQHAPDAKHITDKMPANFYAVGLIHAMLPNAKIIHVNRNPVDTCLSCFTRLFNRHQNATYDLAELGSHYANYARLMDHWRAVLPPGAFLDVHYEDIVSDQEKEARRLIAFCGLEWNDACLNFHQTKRSIRTASVTQVRQPIYKTSVEKWRVYEKYLGPLLKALEQ